MADDRVSTGLRNRIAERAGYCCEYCQAPEQYSPQPFSVEHIQPKSRDGKTETENLCYSCQGCNSYKYVKVDGIDPVSGERACLFHPRRDTWTEHFSWSRDYTQVVPLTSEGRVTVAELRLNRDGLINLRKLLFEAGVHPRE